jgi:phosphate butyryltransferase
MQTKPITTFDELLATAATLPKKRVLIALPTNAETFEAVRIALDKLNTRFILVGEEESIGRGVASIQGAGKEVEIRHVRETADALQVCMELLRQGKADVFMKGSVDTATMMRAVLDEKSGLRTGRLLSDVFITESILPEGKRFLMITDGGLNPAPDLKDKIDLIYNAVSVAHALGNSLPRVAILSATELVSTSLPSTVDAAILAKMNDRGQIKGCIVDGPLGLDNAVSRAAAEEKKIRSEVAGRADIIVAPTIEAANSLAKSTTYFAGWRLAHVVVGGKVPILIPSRADKSDAKLLSIALGIVMSVFLETMER